MQTKNLKDKHSCRKLEENIGLLFECVSEMLATLLQLQFSYVF